jgi:hypothetical protein
MKKFEYKTFTVPTKGWMKYKLNFEALEVQLNELGKLGWEVVTSMSNVYHGGSYASNVIILKREIRH